MSGMDPVHRYDLERVERDLARAQSELRADISELRSQLFWHRLNVLIAGVVLAGLVISAVFVVLGAVA